MRFHSPSPPPAGKARQGEQNIFYDPTNKNIIQTKNTKLLKLLKKLRKIIPKASNYKVVS